MSSNANNDLARDRSIDSFLSGIDDNQSSVGNLKVLIANDESVQMLLLTTLFERNGFLVEPANNGQEAYDLVTSTHHHKLQNFDLIVLDLTMPILDGFDACRKIISFFDNQNVVQMPHIIALTGYLNDRIEKECEEVGFDKSYHSPMTNDIIS